ncbi:signal peptidase [Chryseobacterium phosphatilyticum]|uniref:Signal peptidase n=1 Tax=Chryseobacterium phosphatilyticum TaxID=475075 RepID=A0A316WNU6_9FLAO|nr:signal peptidase [Chryseobacterium phosphatilyticum]PWN63084.1 signal peptidase [Chryseobacterium phosphatilyticum]
MKTINKLVSAIFLLAVVFVQAAPPVPGGGGSGGHGTGEPASPIDMYVYVLSIIAVAFIVFFTKKYKNVKA